MLVFGQFLGHEQPVTSQFQQSPRCVHIFALTAVITVETWPLVCLRGGRETRMEDAVGEDSAWQRPPSFRLSLAISSSLTRTSFPAQLCKSLPHVCMCLYAWLPFRLLMVLSLSFYFPLSGIAKNARGTRGWCGVGGHRKCLLSSDSTLALGKGQAKESRKGEAWRWLEHVGRCFSLYLTPGTRQLSSHILPTNFGPL